MERFGSQVAEVINRNTFVSRALDAVRSVLPFPLLGFDTDNDTVFMNETVRSYCEQAGLAFTRCRPYRKNDQAWVEQKNGAVVRRIVGYGRYQGFEAATVLARLYRVTRLYVNYFQPSFKLAEKEREGAKVRKRYHAPATPAPTLDQFLAGLRTAWQDGEARPTARAKPVAKRGRRRPDPFAAMTSTLRDWFEAEPWRSSGELLTRLRTEHPGLFKAGQLRTLQRRVKEWRSEAAHKMVFRVGAVAVDPVVAIGS